MIPRTMDKTEKFMMPALKVRALPYPGLPKVQDQGRSVFVSSGYNRVDGFRGPELVVDESAREFAI